MTEKDSSHHAYTKEKEELHTSLVTLNKELEELQEVVELLRQEKQQLRTELEDRMETVKADDFLDSSVYRESRSRASNSPNWWDR